MKDFYFFSQLWANQKLRKSNIFHVFWVHDFFAVFGMKMFHFLKKQNHERMKNNDPTTVHFAVFLES